MKKKRRKKVCKARRGPAEKGNGLEKNKCGALRWGRSRFWIRLCEAKSEEELRLR